MQFHIPQFIEMEAKIIGPLTWKQFLLLGGVAAVLFILWFIIGKFLWFIIAIILVGVALSLAFIKIGGHSFPTILKNFLFFSFSSKLYLWKKRKAPPQVIFKKKEVKPKKEVPEEGPVLKVTKKSRLSDLSTQIELRTK